MRVIEGLSRPVVAAPMGGGPSTPELVRAVGGAGGFGFLAAGYKGVDDVAAEMRAAGEGGAVRFGVNLFVPGPAAEPEAYAEYVKGLGVEAGEPRWSDDAWAEKGICSRASRRRRCRSRSGVRRRRSWDGCGTAEARGG